MAKGNTPTLGGNTIWISGTEGQGFDIALSQDAQSRVRGVLEGCGKADDKCYQDVLNTIQAANLDPDAKVQRRGLGQMMSKTVKGAWTIFADVAILLTLNWQMKADKMDNAAFYMPQEKAEMAAISASVASVVHSAGGSVAMTITPTADPLTLTG